MRVEQERSGARVAPLAPVVSRLKPVPCGGGPRFVALRNESEVEHQRARVALARLISEGAALFTSNYVFAETYTALLVRVGREEAIEWGRRFRAGSAIELVRVEPVVEDEAWAILEGHRDKRWSYVDATSFALIERDGGGEAFALDSHFAQRGLRVLPEPEPGGASPPARS